MLGDGPIDLVWAPGYMSHLEQNQWWPAYASFLERMAAFSRLIMFDRRGTGLSDRILALGSFEETQAKIFASYEARLGREDFGVHALAPSAANDERFRRWYARSS